MRPDTRIAAHPFDDCPGIEALHLGIGVQLIEIAHAKGKIGIGEQLDGLGFGASHKEDGRFVQGRLAQQLRECARCLGKTPLAALLPVVADDYAARVEIVVKRLAFTQELGSEDDLRGDDPHRAVGEALAVREAFANRTRIADGHGGLYDHNGVGIDLEDQVYDFLYVGSIEEILLGIVVGRSGYDHEVRIAVRGAAVQRRLKAEPDGPPGRVHASQIFLDILVLNRRNSPVDLLHFLRNDIHRHHLAPLREQHGHTHSYVSRSGYCYLHIVNITIICKVKQKD